MTSRTSRFLQLLGLDALFVAQPLLDLVAQYPEFLVAHGVAPGVLLAVVGLLLLLAPGVVILVTDVIGTFAPRVGEGVHVAAIALFCALGLTQLLRSVGADFSYLLGPVLAAAAMAWAYPRFAQLRALLSFLSLSSLVFVLVFFANPQIRKIMASQRFDAIAVDIREPAPVLLWVFDELSLVSLLDRDRRIDRERFPNIAELTDEAYWFPRATTVSDATTVVIPALLTGLFPVESERKLPIGGDHPKNLFALLESQYDTHIVENVTQMWPRPVSTAEQFEGVWCDLGVVYLHLLASPKIAQRFLPAVDVGWKGFTVGGGAEVNHTVPKKTPRSARLPADTSSRHGVAREFIASIEDSRKPGLYFLHSMLPHSPWVYLPSGERYTTSRPSGGVRGVVGDNDEGIHTNQWVEDPWPVLQSHQAHLLQVGFVDTLVGEAIARLKQVGLYDESLIIITADHGIGFTPGANRRQLEEVTFAEILPIPLFIKVPGQKRGVIDERPVELVDILPTVIEVLGVAIDWQFDGRSVFDDSAPHRTKRKAFQGHYKRFDIDVGSFDIQRLVSRQHERFGGGPLSSLLSFGSSPELIDERLGTIAKGEPTGLVARLRSAGVYEDVDPGSGYVPLEISGLIDEPGPPASHEIAIAVNGVVRSVTRSATLHGQEDFSSLVPRGALRQGRNLVELFEVSQTGGRTRLHEISVSRGVFRSEVDSEGDHGLSEGEFALEVRRGLEYLVNDRGDRIRLEDGALQAWSTARVSEDGSFIRISGLAVDVDLLVPAERVAVFVNGKFFASDTPYLPRKNIVETFDEPNLLHSGFAIELPRARFEPLEEADVRIVALSARGTANESAYPKNAPWCFRAKAADG